MPHTCLFLNPNDSIVKLMCSIVNSVSLWCSPSYKSLGNKVNVYLESKTRLTTSAALYAKEIAVLAAIKPSPNVQLNSDIFRIFRYCVT